MTISCSHLSNSQGGWNKWGGGAKVPELINEEDGINVEGEKKIKINKRVSTYIKEMRVIKKTGVLIKVQIPELKTAIWLNYLIV